MNQQRWGKQTRQRNPSKAREQILAAARHCYGEQGFSATTIDDIAAEAKVNRRTVYRYFDNKKAIVMAVVDEQAAAFLGAMKQRFDGYEGSYPELLKAYVLFVVNNGPLAPGHETLLGEKNAEYTKQYYFSSSAIVEMWAEIMQAPFTEAREKGEIRGEVNYEDLMAWTGRIIMSFIEFPAEDEVLERYLDAFLIRGIS